MMASMPARMLISMANSMNASQAMQASNQAMLTDVSALVDAKMKAVMGGISGQTAGVWVGDQRAAGVGASTGRAVDTEWLGQLGAGDGVSRGPGVAPDQRQPADGVEPAQQPVHPSTHGFAQRARCGHPGRQDSPRESRNPHACRRLRGGGCLAAQRINTEMTPR